MLDGRIVDDPAHAASAGDRAARRRLLPSPTWPGWPASACAPASCAPALSALGHRDRRRGDRRGARAVRLLAGRAARRDRPARHQPAHRHRTARPWPARPPSCPPPAPGMIARIGPVTQSSTPAHRRQRLPQPAHPRHQHQRAVRPGRQPRPPAAVGTTLAHGPLPQRRHRARTGRRPRRGGARSCSASTASTRASGSGSAVSGSTSPASSSPPCSPPRSTRSVLVGFPAAERYLGFDGHPSTIYLRAAHRPGRRGAVRARRHGQPRSPDQVSVSQPSAALVARADGQERARTACSSASAPSPCSSAPSASPTSWSSRVLERRSEIGLRRALGATRGHIRIQFLAEASLLAVARRRRRRRRRALSTAVYARPSTGPPSSPRSPGPAASAPRSSSAPSPDCSPRSAPHGCHRPKPSARRSEAQPRCS